MPRGINENDVWKAADALLLEGARPTIERVRQKIGRGSPNTVTPYLETWFRSLGARITDPMAFSTPPALPDPISEAAKHFWEAALAAARAEGADAVAADRAALKAASDTLDRERAQLQTDRERLSSQLEAKEESVQLLRGHLAESQARAAALLVDLAGKDQLILETRASLTQTEADREALRRHLETERAAFEQIRRDYEAREIAHESRWALEVDRARETAKAAQLRLLQQEKEAVGRIEQLNKSMTDALEQERRLVDSSATKESELTDIRAARESDLATQRAQYNRDEEREREWQARTARLESQLADVLKQLEIKQWEHGALLRTLIERHHVEPITTVTPKRKRSARS
jgi:Plasmid replication region DNA-binding N-term